MNEQLLKDFIATAEAYNYNWGTIFSKFPELQGYDQQVLKDYVATAQAYNYDYSVINPKFPELGFGGQQQEVKKKDTFQDSSIGSQVSQSPSQNNSSLVSGLGFFFNDEDVEEQEDKKPWWDAVAERAKQRDERVAPLFNDPVFKEQLDLITPEMIAGGDTWFGVEEKVVSDLNYRFGPMGFKFEETGATGDFLKVTSPDGISQEISLDNFSDVKNQNEANKLKNFIISYSPKNLESLKDKYQGELRKYVSDIDVDNTIFSLNEEAKNINDKTQLIIGERKALADEFSYLNGLSDQQRNTPEFKSKYDAAIQWSKDLELKENNLNLSIQKLQENQSNVDRAVGSYLGMKAEQGTWYGGGINAVLTGIGRTTAQQVFKLPIVLLENMNEVSIEDADKILSTEAAANNILTGDVSYDSDMNQWIRAAKEHNEAVDALGKGNKIPMPSTKQSIKDWWSSLNESQKKDVIDRNTNINIYELLNPKTGPNGERLDLIDITRNATREVWGQKNTTIQWTKLTQQDFLGGALLGLAESLPAMVGSSGWAGWAQRTANMYGQVTDHVYEEMEKDPQFKYVTENEKLAVVAPIGIATAVLEQFGLRNAFASKGLANSLVLNAIRRSGKTTTAKTLQEFITKDVESRIARGALVMTAAGLAEAETGATQQVAEYLVKDIYNEVKGREMFQTPDFMSSDYVQDVVKAGAQEAIGGFVMGSIPGIISAYQGKDKGFESLSDEVIQFFEAGASDSKLQSSFVSKLKANVASGKITKKEAIEKLNAYREAAGLIRSIPSDLSIENKKKAMNLLKERRALEQQIEGKDGALVNNVKERINEINNELDSMSREEVQQPEGEPTAPSTAPSGNRILTDEEEDRRSNLENAINESRLTTPEGLDPLIIRIGDEIIDFDEAQKELETLNQKANAVQEQTTSEVPVQSETTISEEVEGGKPTTEPQVTTEESQEEVTPSLELQSKQDELKSVDVRIEELAKENEGKVYSNEAFNELNDLAAKKAQLEKDIESILNQDTTPATETAPIVESKDVFIIDGVEYDQEQAIEKSKEAEIKWGSRIEYSGDNEQAKAFADDYNKRTNPYNEDGSLKGLYIQSKVVEALNKLPFKKFAELYRKHINPTFSSRNYKSRKGTTFQQEAPYIIGNASFDFKEATDQFLAFAKEAGIEVAPAPAVETAPVVEAAPVAEVTPAEEAPKRMTREEIRAKEKEVAEENRKSKENRGENINVRDYKRTKKRGQDLKVGDVYVRRIGDTLFVYKVLSKLRKYTGQFYTMDVEILHVGNHVNRKEVGPDGEVREDSRRVGQKTIDTFKNMLSGSGKFNFGEVTLLDNFETAPEAKTEVATEAAPAVEEAPAAEAAPVAEVISAPITTTETAPAKTKKEIKAEKQLDEDEQTALLDIDYAEGKIQELEEEIEIEKGNTKEGIAEIKQKIADVKNNKKLSSKKKAEMIEELKAEIEDFKQDQDGLIENYRDDILNFKDDIRKAKATIKRIQTKKESAKKATEQVTEEKVEEVTENKKQITLGKIRDKFPLVFNLIQKYNKLIGGNGKILSDNAVINSHVLKNLIVVAYSMMPKTKASANEMLDTVIQLEQLFSEVESNETKKVSKEEFKKQVAESGDFNKKQLKIFNALIDSLQTDSFPNYVSSSSSNNYYSFAPNAFSSKDPIAFIHEIGHFAFYNLLSSQDRINFYKYMVQSTNFSVKKPLAKKLAYTSEKVTRIIGGERYVEEYNVADNFAEYFAEQFSQWYMSERLFPADIDAIFQKVKSYLSNVINKLKSGEYVDKELTAFFEKISQKIEEKKAKNKKTRKILEDESYLADEVSDLEDFLNLDDLLDDEYNYMQSNGPVQAMARRYNMSEQGFFPRAVDEASVSRDFAQFGLRVKRANPSAYGPGSLYLVDGRGKKYNPFKGENRGYGPFNSNKMEVVLIPDQVSPMSSSTTKLQDAIDLARDNGYSDAAIRELLIRRGFDSSVVDSLLEFDTTFTSPLNNEIRNEKLPNEFKNIIGGVKDGISLFLDTYNKLFDFSRTTKTGKTSNKRTRTFDEIRNKAIELLEANPIFQNQTDTVKKKLIVAFDRTLKTKRGKTTGQKISELKNIISERLKGQKDLKGVRAILRNFIRQALPAGKIPPVYLSLENVVSPIQGVSLFNDIKKKVYDFARTDNNGVKGKKIVKTVDEIKAYAESEIKKSKLYASQSTDIQTEMVDSFLNTIDVKKMSNTLGIYSQKDVDTLLNSVNTVNDKNLLAKAEEVFEIILSQRDKMKKAALKEMVSLVTKKARAAKTSTGKRRSKGLDAIGHLFFESIKPIIKAAINNDTNAIIEIATELSDQDAIDDVIAKQMRGETLTLEEQVLINKAMAFDTFGDILSMEVEEVNELLDILKENRTDSIARLSQIREDRALQREAIDAEAKDQIKNDFPELFNDDGSIKGGNQLEQDRLAIWQSFKDKKVWDGIKKWASRFDFENIGSISNFFRTYIMHLGTLSNILDKSGKFFTDNVYRPLNRMDETFKMGFSNQKIKLDEIAESISGVKNGYKGIRRMLSKGVIKMSVNGKQFLTNADELLRIYALSKNDVQKEKLKNMGMDDAFLNDAKKILGPELIEFADKVVEYLSNEYFESINDVYSSANDVYLKRVENYFPTKTLGGKSNAKLLEDGNFNGNFNAETAPALKERTDTSGEIEMGLTFTEVLNDHLNSMERYKAYALGVKKLNYVFQSENVNTLLEQTGLKMAIKLAVNAAVNPTSGSKPSRTIWGWIQSKYTGFALAFKLIQIGKQFTSFVQAYDDYQFSSKRRIPGLDTVMFLADVAKTFATFKKNFVKMYSLSGNLRDRIDNALQGNITEIETGKRSISRIGLDESNFSRLIKGFKLAATGATSIGDILSLVGYMANYNRDIANGMDPQEAIEKFNNYNSGLQSLRATEKNRLQYETSETSRLFTMFGSSAFLMLNKVLSSTRNIMRSIKGGSIPSSRDLRTLVINVGVSNALFVAASNIGKILFGSDDDEEEVQDEIFNALIGLNLIEQIPLVGAAVEMSLAAANGERIPTTEGVNPMLSVFRKIKKITSADDYDGSVISAARPIFELASGTQFDQFIGLGNILTGSYDDNDVYDFLGISPSYRPSGENGLIKSKENMTKEELKRYFPNEYKIKYGPGSKDYQKNEDEKKSKREARELRREAMDDYYGYDELIVPKERMTKSELKRYFPEDYEIKYGKGSPEYDENQQESKEKKEFNKKRREAMDSYYNYKAEDENRLLAPQLRSSKGDNKLLPPQSRSSKDNDNLLPSQKRAKELEKQFKR